MVVDSCSMQWYRCSGAKYAVVAAELSPRNLPLSDLADVYGILKPAREVSSSCRRVAHHHV
jgi:hypothetical protein